jgi:uncharacterized membrane protein
MGIAARIKWSALSAIAITMLAVLYATAGTALFEIVENHPGPFTPTVDMLQTVIPPLIGALYLFIAIVMISGPFQYERRRTEVLERYR